jgi:hypothetical protein
VPTKAHKRNDICSETVFWTHFLRHCVELGFFKLTLFYVKKLDIAKMFSRTNGVWVTELFGYLIRVFLLPFRGWSAPRARLV